MKMENQWAAGWYFKASQEERNLIDKVYSFEDFFGDMLFQQDSCTYDLLKCQSKPLDSDEWEDSTMDLPDELEYFNYEFFRFVVGPLENDVAGQYNQMTQTLTVTPEYLSDDAVILHELIHLHEFVVNDLPLYFHDMVLWSLYKGLSHKIPKLNEIISGHAHLLTGSSIFNQGGLHDILFLLKSFDLDIRQGYPLGTVFGYGRIDDFKGYSYNK